MILGIDTAGHTLGVAIMDENRLLCEYTLSAGFTHSETLLPAIDFLLHSCGITCADIDLFGVCAGPGSFTGLRIGLSTVKGLALPFNVLCAGVSTMEAIAWGYTGTGILIAAQDARRGEVYWAAFNLSNHCRLTPDKSSPAAAIADYIASYTEPIIFAGDGAYLCMQEFSDLPNVVSCPDALRTSRAIGVCLAARAMRDRGELCKPADLLPNYHRLSQAERERAERLSSVSNN